MARDIGDGYVTVTERTFKPYTATDLKQLTLEIDRYLRELRGSQAATDELAIVQTRNRKIQRLNTALMIARVYSQKARI